MGEKEWVIGGKRRRIKGGKKRRIKDEKKGPTLNLPLFPPP
jgi:hypothetical protein